MYYPLISSMNKVAPSLYTARTTAFASATAITDTTILNALNTFDLGLISNGLDTKMKAIYPFVGSTATTQKFNFMDARDLDVAFRLTFFGGGTFSSTGYKPNGTNAYANTFLNTSTHLTGSNHSYGVYSRTQDITGAYGVFDNGVRLLQHYFAGTFTSGNYTINNVINYTASPSLKLMLASRTSTTLFTAYRDGSSIGTSSTTFDALPNYYFYFGARNNSNSYANLFNPNELAFAFLGDGLNSTEVTNFTNLVNTMQTSLSRNV